MQNGGIPKWDGLYELEPESEAAMEQARRDALLFRVRARRFCDELADMAQRARYASGPGTRTPRRSCSMPSTPTSTT